MSIYTVKSVWNKPREWQSSHGGHFLSYKVDFETEDGDILKGIEWNKKFESQPPAVAERVAGHLEDGPYGEKFKIDYDATKELSTPQTPSEASSGSSGGSARGWTPEAERDPQKAARITRMHSQEMALRWMAITGETDGGDIQTRLPLLADFFDADVLGVGAGHASSQEAQGSVGHPINPSVDSRDEDKHHLDDFLYRAGVKDSKEREKLTEAYEGLTENQKGQCLPMLTFDNPTEQHQAVLKLRKRAGLPEEGIEQDIPADREGLASSHDDSLPF